MTMAAIQLNDPDPLYWFAAYFLVALVAAAGYFGKPMPMLSNISIGMVLSGLLISAPGAIDYLASGDYASIRGQMLANKPYVESAREFGGLAIAAIYLMVTALWPGARDRPVTNQGND